jgi:hypothetical protein
MRKVAEVAEELLASKRVAVTGVSRTRTETAKVSATAAEYGRQHGVTVIDGGCPLIFPPTSDPGHRVMRWMWAMSGNLPTRA